MSFRIEQDDSSKRDPGAGYTYRIYDGERFIALYWHDSRADDHGIEFVHGPNEMWPVDRVTDFIEGGGPESLRLSARAVNYLKGKRHL